jgi:hypothetical protein
MSSNTLQAGAWLARWLNTGDCDHMTTAQDEDNWKPHNVSGNAETPMQSKRGQDLLKYKPEPLAD